MVQEVIITTYNGFYFSPVSLGILHCIKFGYDFYQDFNHVGLSVDFIGTSQGDQLVPACALTVSSD